MAVAICLHSPRLSQRHRRAPRARSRSTSTGVDHERVDLLRLEGIGGQPGALLGTEQPEAIEIRGLRLDD
jgi:hypothetical protein